MQDVTLATAAVAVLLSVLGGSLFLCLAAAELRARERAARDMHRAERHAKARALVAALRSRVARERVAPLAADSLRGAAARTPSPRESTMPRSDLALRADANAPSILREIEAHAKDAPQACGIAIRQLIHGDGAKPAKAARTAEVAP